MKLFGKPKSKKSPQDSITDLKNLVDMLEKRQTFLQSKIETCEANAKKFVASKKKNEALRCLKQRNSFQNEINKLNGTSDTLTSQIIALENAKMNMEVFNVMNQASNSLRDLHGSMTLDKVDDVMDEIKEQMDIHEEISNAISQPLSSQMEDEDELLRELAEYEQEELDAQLLNIKTPSRELPQEVQQVNFPATSKTVPKLSKEEEEIRALEESLAM
ncbi:hypothetical protein RB653_002343 [Dictyostelium firmibasis]|uniref:Uncharacterized protein n=1 Tax=Dictyostelium firmibasis TaxID=79012 RepID=A0AAN7YVJ6_9MYCE